MAVRVDARATIVDLRGAGDGANVVVRQAVREAGAQLLSQIRRNASTGYHSRRRQRFPGHIPGTGPGPNVVTGDYRRSWRLTVGQTGPRTHWARVETDADQAYRLEYGFVGVDAKGRTYRQPPYPHVGPAIDVVEPAFHARLEGIVSAIAYHSGSGFRAYGTVGRPQ